MIDAVQLHAVTRALHIMCIAGLVGGTLAGVVLRAAMVRADDTARRLTASLLRVLGLRVELAMLVGAVATGVLLYMEVGVKGRPVWLGLKLALVVLAAGLAHLDSARLRRAAAATPDPATLAELLHPALHQATLLAWLAVIAISVVHTAG